METLRQVALCTNLQNEGPRGLIFPLGRVRNAPDGRLTSSAEPVDLSIVVPVFNEEQNLPLLHAELLAALVPLGRRFELIFVDDRSKDRSFDVLLELARHDPHTRLIRFRARCGQTAAMQAGFDHARGRYVVTLDGDLQNDPADIPRLLVKLEEGFDVVAGWRKQRHDGLVLRKLPSRLANRLIRAVTQVSIHDTGCTLKIFRRELLERMPIYAEQHRFLPAISSAAGARITELPVNHRPRRFGKSKYGLGRATRVLLDLFVVRMLATSSQRPLSYFVLLTMPLLLFGGYQLASLVAAAWNGDSDSQWVGQLRFSFLLVFMTCFFYFMLGLVAELAVKASQMHRGQSARVLVREGREHG